MAINLKNNKIFNDHTIFVTPQQHMPNNIFSISKLNKNVSCPCLMYNERSDFSLDDITNLCQPYTR